MSLPQIVIVAPKYMSYISNWIEYQFESVCTCITHTTLQKMDYTLVHIIICLNIYIYDELPPTFYAIQVEHNSGCIASWYTPMYLINLKKAKAIFDYSDVNRDFLQKMYNIKALPYFLGAIPRYSKKISTNPKYIILYGTMTERRVNWVLYLKRYLPLMVVRDIYNNTTELHTILRKHAKIIINIHATSNAVLEQKRLFECTSLGIPVVSETTSPLCSELYNRFSNVTFIPKDNMGAMRQVLQQCQNRPTTIQPQYTPSIPFINSIDFTTKLQNTQTARSLCVVGPADICDFVLKLSSLLPFLEISIHHYHKNTIFDTNQYKTIDWFLFIDYVIINTAFPIHTIAWQIQPDTLKTNFDYYYKNATCLWYAQPGWMVNSTHPISSCVPVPYYSDSQIVCQFNNTKRSMNRFQYMFQRGLLACNISPFPIEFPVNQHTLYGLHLPETPHRLTAFLSQSNLPLNYGLFPAIKKQPGWKGCGLSYYNLIWNAKQQKLPYLIVFEDDCAFPDHFEIVLKIILSFLNTTLQGNWDIFNGCIADLPVDTEITPLPKYNEIQFVQINKMHSMVFNIYNAKIYDRILEWDIYTTEKGNQIDQYIKKLPNLKIITTYPFYFKCIPVESTIWPGDMFTEYKMLIHKSEQMIRSNLANQNL